MTSGSQAYSDNMETIVRVARQMIDDGREEDERYESGESQQLRGPVRKLLERYGNENVNFG